MEEPWVMWVDVLQLVHACLSLTLVSNVVLVGHLLATV